MAQRPLEDTEPRVQRLFQGPYRETGMGPQGLASAGLCVFINNYLLKSKMTKPESVQTKIKQRKWKTALLLSIFLGVERIYLGKTYTGVLKLSLFYLTRSSSSLSIFWFIPVIWWAIDIFLIATRKMKDKEGQELL